MSIVHIHKRKRNKGTAHKLKAYPSENKWISFLDKFLVAVAVGSGISLITWLMYSVFDIPWIVYGFVHKEKPIIITYTLWFIVNMAVVIGSIIY